MRIEKFHSLNEIRSILEIKGFVVERIDDIKNNENQFQYVCNHSEKRLVDLFNYIAQVIIEIDISYTFSDLIYHKHGIFITVDLKDKK